VFKEDKEKKNYLELNIKNNMITLNIEGQDLDFEIDYSNGYPITIFDEDTEMSSCLNDKIIKSNIKQSSLLQVEGASSMNEDFTNYYLKGTKYLVNVKLKGFDGFYKDEKQKELLNYILPPEQINNIENKELENENSQEGLFFKIYYNFISKKYYIKDLGNGFGTFIKLKDKFYITDNSLINIGDSYLLFSYNKPESDVNINEQIENLNNYGTLYCQPYNGDKKYETVVFQSYTKKYFTIGRKEDCDTNIQEAA
jgi:hypothetical protein